MNMSKFKIGDTVEVIQSGKGCAPDRIGFITTITNIGGRYQGVPGVKVKDIANNTYDDWICEESFKLIKRNIKDWDE